MRKHLLIYEGFPRVAQSVSRRCGQARVTVVEEKSRSADGGELTGVQELQELQDKRASSSYLVWQGGQARVLVDAGGGSALRFGESGAKMSQLDVILFSHFHVDHSADIAHNPVPEGATGVERRLHMPPSVIGQIAQAAHVKQLVLSHRMLRTLGKEEQSQSEIRKNYSGSVVFANDLDCFPVP